MASRVTRSASRTQAAAMISIAAVALVAGMIAGTFIKSPQRVAAEAAPPPRAETRVRLERRVIHQTLVVNGQIVPENSTTIQMPGQIDGAPAVIGDLPVQKGSHVEPGTRLATVSGRPVLVLAGRVPAYRALKPGMSGADVGQLQDGLNGAGYRIDDPRGIYGPQTSAAVAALYGKAGFTAPEEGRDAADQAQAAVDQLARQREDSRLALSRLERDRRKSPAEATGTSGPTDDAIVDARRTLDRIKNDYDKAVERLRTQNEKKGATIPLGEVFFIPELPATVGESRAAVGQPASASHITLVSGPLAVRAELTPDQASRIKPGLPAVVVDSNANEFRAVTGPVVSMVDPSQGQSPSDSHSQTGHETYLTTLKPGSPLPEESRGSMTRVSVAVSRTSTEVLAVPAAAVSTAADGSAQIVLPGPPRRTVSVGLGFSGEGFVEVTPKGAHLQPGDEALIGWSSANSPIVGPSPR